MIACGLFAIASCAETSQAGPEFVVGAFPTTIAPLSETLVKVSVNRDCAGGVCTVCGSLFPVDSDGGAGGDGLLYDPRQPAAGATTSVTFQSGRGESDLVYRSPEAIGRRVISFLLFDGATACGGSTAPVAMASVQIEVSGEGPPSVKTAATADAGADPGDGGGQ